MGRVDDRQTRHTIGTHPIISLGEARIALRDTPFDDYANADAKSPRFPKRSTHLYFG